MYKKLTTLFFAALTLTTLMGCQTRYNILSPYRLTIQQGNVITPKMARKIHLGMTKREVIKVLGDPVMTNVFSRNRWHYVHTLQKADDNIHVTHYIMHFENNKLIHVDTRSYTRHPPANLDNGLGLRSMLNVFRPHTHVQREPLPTPARVRK